MRYFLNSKNVQIEVESLGAELISLKVDGRFYGNEGNNPAMLLTTDGSYWGMGSPDGDASVWIRTTSQGIIPYAAKSAGSGTCYLGTSSWYFGYAYIDNIYGSSFSGNAATATKATKDGDGNTISTTYLKLSGGTMTGSIITPKDDNKGIIPHTNNYGQIGSSDKKFFRMYATTFYGALSGNATTATTL
jgi:hypothetical protein